MKKENNFAHNHNRGSFSGRIGYVLAEMCIRDRLGYLDATHKGLVTGKDRDDYIETARRKAHDLKDVYKRQEYFYDDSNIMAIISRLRKKLEVNPSSPKYIQTVKGIGYRFNKGGRFRHFSL